MYVGHSTGWHFFYTTWQNFFPSILVQMPPLLVQRCNGTTAGLGYLEVGWDSHAKMVAGGGGGGGGILESKCYCASTCSVSVALFAQTY
jgi:hypothetical protein